MKVTVSETQLLRLGAGKNIEGLVQGLAEDDDLYSIRMPNLF